MHFSLLFILPAIARVACHGLITAVQGTNGVNGIGFGVDTSTPRDGTRAKPFQQDTSIIRANEIASGKTGVCGRTKQSGSIDIAAAMAQAEAAGMPSVGPDGVVRMTLHVVNQDGGGEYSCVCSASGDGSDFAPMQIMQQVPGKNFPGVGSLTRATATDFPLVAKMAPGTRCSGGSNGNTCLIRCANAAIAGPFGSCVAVMQEAGTESGTSTTQQMGGTTLQTGAGQNIVEQAFATSVGGFREVRKRRALKFGRAI